MIDNNINNITQSESEVKDLNQGRTGSFEGDAYTRLEKDAFLKSVMINIKNVEINRLKNELQLKSAEIVRLNAQIADLKNQIIALKETTEFKYGSWLIHIATRLIPPKSKRRKLAAFIFRLILSAFKYRKFGMALPRIEDPKITFFIKPCLSSGFKRTLVNLIQTIESLDIVFLVNSNKVRKLFSRYFKNSKYIIYDDKKHDHSLFFDYVKSDIFIVNPSPNIKNEDIAKILDANGRIGLDSGYRVGIIWNEKVNLKAETDYIIRSKNREKLVFHLYESASITIIVPCCNKWEDTFLCLKSILFNTKDVEYNIILADDYSGDETSAAEEYMENVTVIHNKRNLGYAETCNNAIRYATGKYILLLDNDCYVQKSWLKTLYDTVCRDHSIGLAGPKVLLPDGTLKQAGGVLCNDATAIQYGFMDDPDKPEYNYLREANFVVGALMIEKNIWDEIGGLDVQLCSEYSQIDLALKVRSCGRRVVYQPKSEITYIKRATFKDAKILFSQNRDMSREKFLNKWKDTLISDYLANGESIFLARDGNTYKKTVLFIDYSVPRYDHDAGSRTINDYLNILLNMGWNVKFLTQSNVKDEPYTSKLQQSGIEVIYGDYSKNWEEWLKENGQYIDYVFMSRPDISIAFFDKVKAYSTAKIIYNVCDLHFLRLQRKYEISKNISDIEDSLIFKAWETKLIQQSDYVLTLSTEEKSIISEEFEREDTIIAPVFIFKDSDQYSSYNPQKKDIMFVGGFLHEPNVDAVEWFVTDIFPVILKKLPEVKFYIVGSNPSDKIRGYASDNIIVTGYITDDELNKLYEKTKVFVIPLRYGAGVKGKTIEAMHNGMAIVSTSIGLEGIEDIEKLIKAKDSAEDFANEVIDLYLNDDRIRESYYNNINFIKEKYSYERAMNSFRAIFK